MSFAASKVAHAIRSQSFTLARTSFSQSTLKASRSYATKPNATRPSPAKQTSTSTSTPSPSQAKEMGATTTAAELHPLPDSVKDAGVPSEGSQQPSYDSSGNSTSPVDHSSRPSGPGPSAPPIDPSVAAPGTIGERKGGSGSGKASYSTSAASYQDDTTIPTMSSASNWGSSFDGMSAQPFPKEVSEILEAPINEIDIEIKPDGLIYLPEIKYRRILNKAFGPGGWGLAPRTETNVTDKIVSREWALICLGRFVSTARGEQEYFDPSGVATASEGAKSNALMRCCKDLGIAHELWSPRFIRDFKSRTCVEVFVENAATKKKKKLWRRKDSPAFEYPWKEGR